MLPLVAIPLPDCVGSMAGRISHLCPLRISDPGIVEDARRLVVLNHLVTVRVAALVSSEPNLLVNFALIFQPLAKSGGVAVYVVFV